jgi:purine-binding chemotaxis protein CheW
MINLVKDRMNTVQKESEEILENMYVTIYIDDEIYGIDVTKVNEVIGMTDVSFVPNALSYMKGMVNIRGIVIPLIDMRLRFNLAEKEYDKLTVIVIAKIKGKTLGLIVDSVADVVSFATSSIQQTPHFSASVETDFIDGVGQDEDKIVIILNVDKIFSENELESME